MKQDIFNYPKNNISKLSKLKKNGTRIGTLKFKKEINSIPLRQYGITYKIYAEYSKIKIQGIKKAIYVKGLSQFKDKNIECANAFLVKKPSGYYIKITTYEDKEIKQKTGVSVGLDFGIKDGVTTSDGKKYSWNFEETKRIKKLSKCLARKNKGSKNRYKTNKLLSIAYEKLNNQKKDAKNKFVSKMIKDNDFIVIQDESIAEWKSSRNRGWGRRIQHSILGGIISSLKEKPETLIIDKWIPTTQMCSVCGAKQKIELDIRRYRCPVCGLEIDRDINSAKNILNEGMKCIIPTDYREFTLVERSLRNSEKQEDVSH